MLDHPCGVDARKLEYDCPPTPKPREGRKSRTNPPRPFFQLLGAYYSLGLHYSTLFVGTVVLDCSHLSYLMCFKERQADGKALAVVGA